MTELWTAIEPAVLELLRLVGHDIMPLRTKRLDEFLDDDAPRMDFVFTLCDRAANAECARWPGAPVTAHWGVPDPLAARGGEAWGLVYAVVVEATAGERQWSDEEVERPFLCRSTSERGRG